MDHEILIQKLEPYGKNGKNLSWFKKHLANLKQYILFESNNNNQIIINNHKKNFEKTELLDIICGVPLG